MNDERSEIQKYLRVQTVLLCAILAVVLVAAVFACVSFAGMSRQMQAMASMDTQTMNQAVESLKNAADKLQQLDMDQLNELVGSLQQVAANIERTTSAFSGLFGRG